MKGRFEPCSGLHFMKVQVQDFYLAIKDLSAASTSKLSRPQSAVKQEVGFRRSALLGPREHDAGDIAGQRNANSRERRPEKINLREHNKTTQRCQTDNEQKR